MGVQLEKPPALQSPKTVGFADLWYDARAIAKTTIPTKTDLPLPKLVRYMPNLAMLKREPDGRARYTLFGTGLAAAFGHDLTGHYAETPMNEEARDALGKVISAFYEEHGPDALFGRWTMSKARTSTGRLIEFENLALPYREASDDSIRYIAYAITLTTLDYGEGMVERFPDTATRMFNAETERPDWLQQDPESAALVIEANVA
ncbi:MAG: PAS domain-containing protein [Parvibaculaceae bacterium]